MVSAMAVHAGQAAKQLDSLGTVFTLIGHSESRVYGMNQMRISQAFVVGNPVSAVFCIGESQGESGDYLAF